MPEEAAIRSARTMGTCNTWYHCEEPEPGKPQSEPQGWGGGRGGCRTTAPLCSAFIHMHSKILCYRVYPVTPGPAGHLPDVSKCW